MAHDLIGALDEMYENKKFSKVWQMSSLINQRFRIQGQVYHDVYDSPCILLCSLMYCKFGFSCVIVVTEGQGRTVCLWCSRVVEMLMILLALKKILHD